MKFTYWLLVLVMLVCLAFSTGCLPVVPEEPEEPIPALSIEISDLSWKVCGNHHHIYYAIENTGDVGVNYELTFVVDFDGHTDITVIVESDESLEVGSKLWFDTKVECLICSDLGNNEIVSVNVTYDLWE